MFGHGSGAGGVLLVVIVVPLAGEAPRAVTNLAVLAGSGLTTPAHVHCGQIAALIAGRGGHWGSSFASRLSRVSPIISNHRSAPSPSSVFVFEAHPYPHRAQ